MGEAKRRRDKDKYYGAIPKRGKGLVISSPIKITEGKLVASSALDPQELRFSLLFWDRLVWPTNNIVMIGGGAESDYLESAGILRRPHHNLTGSGSLEDAVAITQLRTFEELSQSEPGTWSLAQGASSFLDMRKVFKSAPGCTYTLTNAVPVPDVEVPLTDILDFKERRRDELVLLRLEIESYLPKIAKAGNTEEALKAATADIECACVDVLRVSQERKFPLRLTSLKTSLNIDWSKVAGAAVLSMSANGFGMPALHAALGAVGATLIAGAVQLKTEASVGIREDVVSSNPYKYASSYTHEVFNR